MTLFYVKYYGKRIPYDWHREYSAFTGKFNYQYIPELLFIPFIERMYNKKELSIAFGDKTLLPTWLNGLDYVKTPKIYCSATNKFNIKFNNHFCTFIDLLDNMYNIGKCFIKPAMDSNSGIGCTLLNIINGIDIISKHSLKEILDEYNYNFLIEELIIDCKEMKLLHPKSLNTFRVITYLLDGKVYTAPVVMRIGQGGNIVDNAHAGGIFINVELVGSLGILDEYAFNEFMGKFDHHPTTNITFKNYEIPYFSRIIEAAKKTHEERMSNFGMLSFDMVLNEDYFPVIIEINSIYQSCWFSQMASGKPFFGDNTKEILKLIRNK